MVNLDCITLLMMHSVWAKPLTFGKLQRTWLCSPRKDIQKFLQVSAASVVMILGITRLGTAERETVELFL